ncbi:hypothetical protein [Mycobacterium sp. SMC-14]|uniref:hypothetical protein n=1 Tax=Mycobacterium sp. SMC-14 TaxID=3385968 RepID=UPI00390C8595
MEGAYSAKGSEHLRLDYRGVRVIGDLLADKQFIVIGKLPDVTDRNVCTEFAESG